MVQKNIIILILLFSLNLSSQTKIGNIEIDDVALHVDGCILMTCGFSQLYYNLSKEKDKTKSILFGAGTTLILSIGGKELIYDKWMNRGVPSWKDVASDCWGVFVGCIIMVCKFDFDDVGLIIRKISPRKSKFNKRKYFLG